MENIPSDVLQAVFVEAADFADLDKKLIYPDDHSALSNLRRSTYAPLTACSYVCKAWRALALHVLFRHILIAEWYHVRPLVEFLQSKREVSKEGSGFGFGIRPRSLYIRPSSAERVTEEDLQSYNDLVGSLFSICPSLMRAAYLPYDAHMPQAPKIPRGLSPLLAISSACIELALAKDPWLNWSSFLEVLSSFSQLRALHLYFPTLTHRGGPANPSTLHLARQMVAATRADFPELGLPALRTLNCHFVFGKDIPVHLKMLTSHVTLPALEHLEIHQYESEDGWRNVDGSRDISDGIKAMMTEHGPTLLFFLYNRDIEDRDSGERSTWDLADIHFMPQLEHLVVRMPACTQTKKLHKNLKCVDIMYPGGSGTVAGDKRRAHDVYELSGQLEHWLAVRKCYPALAEIRVGDPRFVAGRDGDDFDWDGHDGLAEALEALQETVHSLIAMGVSVEDLEGNPVDVDRIQMFEIEMDDEEDEDGGQEDQDDESEDAGSSELSEEDSDDEEDD